jgi:hypothetical protein
MAFLRPVDYFLNRFYDEQELAWLAFKAGKDIVLDWGRRSGKSELMVEIFVEDIEDYGKDCLYIALTQSQAHEIMWPKLYSKLSSNKDWKPNAQRLEWKYLPANATLSLKGADLGKDRLRGNAKRVIGLDEFAFAKDPTIVKDVLAPQLIDYNGQFIYASTPKGKNHFWKLKQIAIRNPDRYYTSHSTMFKNPFVSAQGREKLIAEYTGTDDPLYRQEVMAEYIDFFGLVFALAQDSYIEQRWDEADLSHSYHWRGVDHGFNPDPTACVWIAYNKRKGYFQVYSEYKQKKLLVHQHAEIIQAQEKFRFISTISDIDPQLIAEYENIGLSMSPAGKYDKESRLLRIVSALKTGKLKIAKNCTELLNEMQTYEWNQDGEDHLIDALIYGFTNLVIPEEQTYRSEDQAPLRESIPAFDSRIFNASQDFGDDYY